jgi:hypothetical protein
MKIALLFIIHSFTVLVCAAKSKFDAADYQVGKLGSGIPVTVGVLVDALHNSGSSGDWTLPLE